MAEPTSSAGVVLKRYALMGSETIPCNLCGARDDDTLATTERFGTATRTAICRSCGLVYLNPRWSAEAYRRFYEEDYRRLMGEGDDPPRENMLRGRVLGADLVRFCGDFVKPGSRVLDVGSAAGGVLWAFREGRGCDCLGIEPSVEQSRYAREALGLTIRTGAFEEIELPEESFDLILILQTLNHLLDPAGFMRRARSLLRTSGKLLIVVQNFPEYARRAPRPFQVDHCYYFSPATLECMLRLNGFEPVATDVGTARTAAQVDGYMWHRSASIHIRSLAMRADPEPGARLPDPRPIRRAIESALRERTSLGRRVERFARGLVGRPAR